MRPTFRCGHPNVPENRTANERPACRTCKRIRDNKRTATRRRYNIDRTRWRKCDHPRTPENTARCGSDKECCRTCKLETSKQWRETNDDPRYLTHRRVKNPLLALLRQLAPRPLPIVDNSGRSYEAFPRKYA